MRSNGRDSLGSNPFRRQQSGLYVSTMWFGICPAHSSDLQIEPIRSYLTTNQKYKAVIQSQPQAVASPKF